MDNFRFDITWLSENNFRCLLEMVLRSRPGGGKDSEIVFYTIDPQYGMIFFWSEPSEAACAQKLPYPMKTAAAIDFAWNWLAAVDYGPEPDHDGSNSKGWRIYNYCKAFGHVKNEWAAICAVQPVWAEHGK